MSILTKNQLSASNQASFPDNTTGAITPQILRNFNQDVIDTLVDSLNTGSFAITTGSNDFTQANSFTSISASSFVSASAFAGDGSRLTNITSSISLPILDEGIPQGNATSMNFTGSNISAVIVGGVAVVQVTNPTGSLVTTSSFNQFTSSINQFTASQETKNSTLATYTASVDTKFTSVGVSTASLNTFTSSQETKNTTLETYTASVNNSITALNSYTASNDSSITNLNSFTSSQNTKNSTLATYTGSNDTKWNTLGTQTGSFVTETESGSFLITASANLNTITFTKGNNTTFAVTVNTGSGTTTDLTSLNAFTASQDTKNSTLETYTSSVNNSISALNTFTASQSTASLVSSITNLNTFSSSVLIQLNTLANVTSSLISKTGSYATTGSNTFVGNQTITGNISAFSASFTYLQTIFESSSIIYSSGSNQFGDELSDVQTLSGSVKVQGSLTINGTPVQTSSVDITALNAFTASQDTKDITLASVTSSLNSATASLFTSASLSLTTASVNLNTITFTKGDASTFNIVVNTGSAITTDITSLNAFTASQETKNATLGSLTGSFATTGSNTFIGNQTLTGSLFVSGNISLQQGFDLLTHHVQALAVNGVEIQNNGGNVVALFGAGGSLGTTFYGQINATSISASTINGLGDPLAFSTSVDSRLDSLEGITASVNTSASLALYTASFDTGSRNLTFTKGDTTTFAVNIPDVSGSTIDTGSFATTGSNTFTGDQTLIDNAGNFFTISDASGSMLLVAKSYTSASAHISSSANQVNLIFKNNDNTADTIISGSGNIFSNQVAPGAAFKRYVGGNNNIFSGPAAVPQITGSMAFSPAMNQNFIAGTFSMRGPVSSSTYSITQNNILGTLSIGSSALLNADKLTSGLTMTGNNIAGTLSLIANQSALTGSTTFLSNNNIGGVVTLNLSSSATTFANNIINDSGFVFTNQYYNTSIGLGTTNIVRNNIAGNGNTIIVSGSQPAGATSIVQISDNFIGGGSNFIYGDISNPVRTVGLNAYNQAMRNIVFGSQLIITGSSYSGDFDTQGSAFFGRYNSIDGNKDRTAETIFAVGTGNTSARKTGFLIDSGSNTFIEGTLNVSGATSLNGNLNITGSLTASLQQGFVYVGNASGITTTVATSSFISTPTDITSLNAFTASQDIKNSTLSNVTASLIAATGSYATTGSNSFIGSQSISGSLSLTGSAYGNVVSMSINSNTASMDLSLGNYFELSASVSPIRIEVSNLRGGLTSTLTLNGVTSSTINFSSNVLQPSGSAYTASVSGSNDILSFVAFNSSKVNVVSTLKMI